MFLFFNTFFETAHIPLRKNSMYRTGFLFIYVYFVSSIYNFETKILLISILSLEFHFEEVYFIVGFTDFENEKDEK